MNENIKSPEPEPSAPASPVPAEKPRFWWLFAAFVAVFLLGFVPMWLRSGRLADETAVAQRQLREAQIQLVLANAVLEARRGEHEIARQGAAAFFTLLTMELEHEGEEALFAPAARNELKALLTQRDDLITLLARGDPASAERLAGLYVAFRKASGF